MTINDLLILITQRAHDYDCIHYSCGGASLYELNTKTVKDYPIFFAQLTSNTEYGDNTTIYSLNLYYIDRLLRDNSNDIRIYSVSTEFLKSFINGLRHEDDILEVVSTSNITLFTETERMNDKCSGAWVNVRLRVRNENNGCGYGTEN